MWDQFFGTPQFLLRTRREGYLHSLVRIILSVFLILLVSNLVQTVAIMIPLWMNAELSELMIRFTTGQIDDTAFMAAYNEVVLSFLSSPPIVLVSLFSTSAVIAGCIFFWKKYDHASFAALGIEKKGAAKAAAIGAGIGVGMIALTVGINLLLRGLTFRAVGITGATDVLLLVLFFLAFLIQASAEELLFRGVFLSTVCRVRSPLLGVLLSSAFFAFFHGANSGVTVLGIVNVFLFGLVLSLLLFRTGSLFACAALHAAWNFVGGNILGVSISGQSSLPSVLLFHAESGMAYVNGGSFGPEGGLAATLTLVLALALFSLWKPQKNDDPQGYSDLRFF